jgi:NMD protein affecting ribosome stability and mRNA decay
MAEHPTSHKPFQPRSHHILEEALHDAYRARARPKGPAVCTDCGAVFRNGRWQWGEHVRDAHRQLCPACLRIKENYPAGYVTLSGEFFRSHRAEITALARNEEAREREDHPLQRIMALEEAADETRITTTDVHLARRIGDAIYHAYHGNLEVKYSPDEYLVRVSWSR